MQVLVIILNKVEYLEDVIALTRKAGIRGATILDGLGGNTIGKRQLNTTSFLASIVESLEQRGEVKKVIISLVEREDQINKAVDLIGELVNNPEDKTSGAIMMTLPVNHMRGGELERHIIRREEKKKLNNQ